MCGQNFNSPPLLGSKPRIFLTSLEFILWFWNAPSEQYLTKVCSWCSLVLPAFCVSWQSRILILLIRLLCPFSWPSGFLTSQLVTVEKISARGGEIYKLEKRSPAGTSPVHLQNCLTYSRSSQGSRLSAVCFVVGNLRTFFDGTEPDGQGIVLNCKS